MLRFFKQLFEKGEDPLPTFEDPTLGRMDWSNDDEAWIGTYNGFRFALSYDRKATPTPAVLAYAIDALKDPTWLTHALAAEKKSCLLESPPSAKDEILGLKFDLVHFSILKGQRYIIAGLDGGEDYRCWRIEFHDRKCDGMGFDR